MVIQRAAFARVAERSSAHGALGRAVREIRKQQGLSQEALGLRIDTDRTYVGGIERGEKNPTFEVLGRIAEGLGMTASELLERAEEIAGGEPAR